MGLIDSLLGNAGEQPLDKIAEEFAPLLAPGETLQRAFGLIRDLLVFTDRRLVLVNKQGVTGKPIVYRSIPYRSIAMFSLQTEGHFDLESELRIWLHGQDEPLARTIGRGEGAADIVALLAQNASH